MENVSYFFLGARVSVRFSDFCDQGQMATPAARKKNSLKRSAKSSVPLHVLRLYVTGLTPSSIRAIDNIRRICEEELQGRCDLEVIDLYQDPEVIKKEDIVASPTLIKKLPPPLRRLIGDFSDRERVLVGLNIKVKQNPPGKGKESPYSRS